ncbi:protein phosphatase 1 regulatory subunit 3C-B-like [Paramisgurnus dabryanus]|uniref:protein phosphatase 1 regulatory subunit 3C-B-like n=1 Tax=Paramisgurnus dabryanus TaxID=90735 RepID=UPI0031F408A6
MTCVNVMSRLGTPVSMMSLDMMGFRCRSSPNINHHHHHLKGLSSPKPLRSCITHHHHSEFEYRRTPSRTLIKTKTHRQEKRVAFADSKGLSLITVRLFSEKDETFSPEPVARSRIKKLNCVKETVKTSSSLRVGFEQPCLDYQAFRCRLQERMVLLENCKVTRRSIMGTVRVRNVCFEKAVNIRITFDTWRSYLDVPCTYLDQCYGEPGTDVFEFNVTVPEQIKTGERIEFCVSYLPGGFGEASWDNNDGNNYCIHVCEA